MNGKAPEFIRIVLFSMGAAIGYGILHDQVTAHLCVEYFTLAHPLIVPTESPFLLAIFWGIFATWWVGLFLGGALALAARAGPAPKLGLDRLKRPIVILMLVCGIAALLAGAAGAWQMTAGQVSLPEPWPEIIPADRHLAFFAVAVAHVASYAAGGLGGLILILLTIRKRLRAGDALTGRRR